jgi:hypothetical protein
MKKMTYPIPGLKTVAVLLMQGWGMWVSSLYGMDLDNTVCDLVECAPRGGLPNFFNKLEKGETVRVAYVGGSITAQAGWRVKSLAYFQSQYPKAKLEEIYAALGGTGSELGVFRMDHDVLSLKPDLLFVEFAVNDEGSAPENVLRSMEGVVRKTYKAYPDCDICFIYTITVKNLKEMEAGKMSRTASVMEHLAEYYRIPSIHLGLEVYRLESQGKLAMNAPEAKVEQVAGKELDQDAPLPVGPDGKIPFSRDGSHPYNNTGHRLYMEAIIRSIPAIKGASTPVGPHALPDPMTLDNLENTVMVPLEKATMTGPWKKLPGAKSMGNGKTAVDADLDQFVPAFWKGEPGATLSFRFKGSKAMIYDILGPDCGKVEITVDGKTTVENRIDAYTIKHRLSTLGICKNLDPQQVHDVTIKLLAEPIDKMNVLMESRRTYMKSNPVMYDGLNWYAAAIFLVGEMAP